MGGGAGETLRVVELRRLVDVVLLNGAALPPDESMGSLRISSEGERVVRSSLAAAALRRS